MLYLFIIIGSMIISMSFYMYYHFKVSGVINLVFKLMTSFWFVLLGVVAIFIKEDKNINLSILILIGLLCGFLGDAVLGLRRINSENNKVFFGMGLVVFLIGNVFYSRAYLTFSSYPKYIYFFIAMVITMILIVVLEFTKVNLGRFRICGYIYAYVSSFLLITVTMGMISKASVGMMLALLGVISFIISDFILGYLYFKKINPSKFKFYKYINIIAYYFGQVLIALSIYFLI